MKKTMIKFMCTLGTLMCTMAAYITVHASDFICLGKYYQPELPNDIESFKNKLNNKR